MSGIWQVSRRGREDADCGRGRTPTGRHNRPWAPGRDTSTLDAEDIVSLQRTVGNQAVAALLTGKAKEKTHHKPPVDDDAEDVIEDVEQASEKPKATGQSGLAAVQRFTPTEIPAGKMFDYKTGKVVKPSFPLSRPLSKRSNTDSSTTTPKTPKMSGTIAWDSGASKWRYQVESIRSPGVIQLVYYSMSHFPAPVPNNDSGPLLNVKKSNWRAIEADLTTNRTGIAGNWSAYLAEDTHEDYHWFQEWLPTIKPKFTQAQTDIAALGVADPDPSGHKVSYWDARATLIQQAKTAFKARVLEGRNAFNALGDSPGDPPYVAQAPSIDNVVNRVRNLAASKKWP
jgi:hypothetical protein